MWTVLTGAMVKQGMRADEISRIQSSATEKGLGDPFDETVANGPILGAVRFIYGYIAAWRGNTLGTDGTLPPQLMECAKAIVRWRMLTESAVGTSPTLQQGETRRKEYEDALALLERVADGKFVVEQPDTPGGQSVVSQTPTWGGETKQDFIN